MEKAEAWRAKAEALFDGKVCERRGGEEALVMVRDRGMDLDVPSAVCFSCIYGELRDIDELELRPVCKKWHMTGKTMCLECLKKTEEWQRVLKQREGTGRGDETRMSPSLMKWGFRKGGQIRGGAPFLRRAKHVEIVNRVVRKSLRLLLIPSIY